MSMSSESHCKPTLGPTKRSRNGCRQCRRRHRRCDEAKPSCTYCRSVSKVCEYSRELSWGGRPFAKSRFGQCVSKDSDLITVATEIANPPPRSKRSKNPLVHRDACVQFVYTWKPGAGNSPAHDRHTLVSLRTAEPSADPEFLNPSPDRHCIGGCSNFGEGSIAVSTSQTNAALLGSPAVHRPYASERRQKTPTLTKPQIWILNPFPQLSSLPARHRILLDFFVHDVCLALSCHEGIRMDICSALIPMAQDNAHLRAAMICAAACRQDALRLNQDPQEVVRLRLSAIQLLSRAVNCNRAASSTVDCQDLDRVLVALAASLILCISEIVSSECTSGGWRIHLVGASALMKHLRNLPPQDGCSFAFVDRLYTSLKAVSVGCGMKTGPLSAGLHTVCEVDCTLDQDSNSADYIDDLSGFSTALIPIFEQIHRNDDERERCDNTGHLATLGEHLTWFDWRQPLIQQVQVMLLERKPRLRRAVAQSLSEAAKTDFYRLDEAYHHMALLRLGVGFASTLKGQLMYGAFHSQQLSVKRIIDCINALDMTRKPSPVAAALPPLFVAGCAAAYDRDRASILALLRQMRNLYGMGNVRTTEAYLIAHWESSTLEGLFEESSQGFDFLPY